jgi:hypothetical protein
MLRVLASMALAEPARHVSPRRHAVRELYTLLAMVGLTAYYWWMWRIIRRSDNPRAKWLVAHTGRGSLFLTVFAPVVVILSPGWRLLHPIPGSAEW